MGATEVHIVKNPEEFKNVAVALTADVGLPSGLKSFAVFTMSKAAPPDILTNHNLVINAMCVMVIPPPGNL